MVFRFLVFTEGAGGAGGAGTGGVAEGETAGCERVLFVAACRAEARVVLGGMSTCTYRSARSFCRDHKTMAKEVSKQDAMMLCQD